MNALRAELELREVCVNFSRSGFQLGPITHTFLPGITAVVGVNGAGKSTLFSTIAGGLKATSGELVFPDQGFSSLLPQNPQFPGSARIEDVLVLFAWLRKVSDAKAEVAMRLEQLGLEAKKGQKVSSLSGGMVRRLGIAQTLIGDPKVVLLDEPTAGLDPLQRIAVRDLIVEQLRDRITLVSTHLVEDVRAIADQVIVLRAGELIFAGNVADLEGLTTGPGPRGESPLEMAISELIGGPPHEG